MSLADRFGGGVPRGFAPGNQALERLLEELGTAGTQMGSSLEGLDLSWAEPDLNLGGLSLPLTVDEAEAEAAAGATGEARRAVRPAARAGAPGGGSVSHGTSASGAAALAGRRLPAGGAPQGLGLLAELAMEYQQARVGGAAAAPGPGRSGPGRAAPASAPDPARRRGEAQMRPASVTERERFVPGHGQVPEGSGRRTGDSITSPPQGSPNTGRFPYTASPSTGLGEAGNHPGSVGSRLQDDWTRQLQTFPELNETSRALASAAPGLDGVSNPLAAWGADPSAHQISETPTAAPHPTAGVSQPEAAFWPQGPEPSLLPPEWGGNWQPVYVSGGEEDETSNDEALAAPGDIPGSMSGYGQAEEPAIAGTHTRQGILSSEHIPTVATDGLPAGPGGPSPAAPMMAPSHGALLGPAAVPAPDLDSVLSSALASAVGGLPGLGPIPGISGSPTINWTPSTPTVPAGAEGARQQVNLSMQVQLQGGQAAAAPAGDDLARRIKEILIAEARRHGIDL